MRKNKSYKNTIHSILYVTTPHTKSLQYKQVMKVTVRKKTEKVIGQLFRCVV